MNDEMFSIDAEVRFGDILTDDEAADIRRRQEKPLVTIKGDRIWIAYDRADVVYTIPIQRLGAVRKLPVYSG